MKRAPSSLEGAFLMTSLPEQEKGWAKTKILAFRLKFEQSKIA